MTSRTIGLRAAIYTAILGFGIYFVTQSSANATGWVIIGGAVVLFALLAVRVLADRAKRDG